MNTDDNYEDLRVLLRTVDLGALPELDPAVLIRRGRRRRRIASAERWAGLVTVVGLLAGGLFWVGYPGDHKATPIVPAGPSSAATNLASPTASADQSPSAKTSPPVQATHTCRAAELLVSAADGGMGLGHWAEIILFRNVGSTACSLRGYPVVATSIAGGGPSVEAIPSPGGYLGGSYQVVTVGIAPGQFASTILEGTNNPVGSATSCPSLSNVFEVTAPGTATAVQVNLNANPLYCSVPRIHPLVAGTTGRPAGQ